MAKKFKLKSDLLAKAKEQRDSSDEEIRKKIIILDELKELIRPLSEVEFEQLEQNILEEGCKVPLVLWKKEPGQFVLVDGHNRYAICQKHALKFPIEVRQYQDIEEVQRYMINNQLGRRNLTNLEMNYYIGLKYENEKQRGLKRSQETGHTSERIAKEFNTSTRSVERYALMAKGLNRLESDLRKAVLAGEEKSLKKGDLEWLGGHEEGDELNLSDAKAALNEKEKAKKLVKDLKDKDSKGSKSSAQQAEITTQVEEDDLPPSEIEAVIPMLRKAVKDKNKSEFEKAMASLEHIREMLFEL